MRKIHQNTVYCDVFCVFQWAPITNTATITVSVQYCQLCRCLSTTPHTHAKARHAQAGIENATSTSCFFSSQIQGNPCFHSNSHCAPNTTLSLNRSIQLNEAIKAFFHNRKDCAEEQPPRGKYRKYNTV